MSLVRLLSVNMSMAGIIIFYQKMNFTLTFWVHMKSLERKGSAFVIRVVRVVATKIFQFSSNHLFKRKLNRFVTER